MATREELLDRCEDEITDVVNTFMDAMSDGIIESPEMLNIAAEACQATAVIIETYRQEGLDVTPDIAERVWDRAVAPKIPVIQTALSDKHGFVADMLPFIAPAIRSSLRFVITDAIERMKN